MLSPDALQAYDDFLIELNRAAGEVILPIFRADLGVEDKHAGVRGADFDPVTRADKGAEAAIRRLIAEHYPDHGVIGEEYGEDRPDADFVWVLDPIDGTRAFVAGLPVWTTLIALRRQGVPVLGSIGQSFTGEIFIGHAGGARVQTREGSRPLKARAGVALRDAVIATTDPEGYFLPEEIAVWRTLRARARIARFGCDAYAYAMVAAGQIDLVAEGAALKCWDIEAALPIMAGAGAATSTWSGAPIGDAGGQMIFAGSAALLDEAVSVLQPAARPPFAA